MKISILRFAIGWIILSILLTGIVPIYDWTKGVFFFSNTTPPAYSVKEMIFAIIGESLRAFLVCYFYPHFKGEGFKHALQFGLLTSLLIASIWLFVGYGSFHTSKLFLINDGILLGMQGILTGLMLFVVYKR